MAKQWRAGFTAESRPCYDCSLARRDAYASAGSGTGHSSAERCVARSARGGRAGVQDGKSFPRFQLGMLALCYLGPLEGAAQNFDAIQPPYLDSQDRARQAYARLALSRSIAAMKESDLDEAFKQLGYFHPQVYAIQPGSEIRIAEE